MHKNRFPFGIIAAGLLVLLSAAGCSTDATDNVRETIGDNQDITLVCLGDSLTAGYGATTPGRDDDAHSYPAYLQKKINDTVAAATNGTVKVVNEGLSGDTSAGGLNRIDQVLFSDPQIVIVELGANDLGRYPPVLPAATQANLQNIIGKLDNGNRKIYIAKFYTEEVARETAAGFGITDHNLQTALITQYDAMFDALVSSNNVELIEDIWTGVWGEHMSDRVHPDAAGYEIMAGHYFDALRPYLREKGLIGIERGARGTR
jgi:acyl-CoA thioesterase-1